MRYGSKKWRPHLYGTAELRAWAIWVYAKKLAGHTESALANPHINPTQEQYQRAFLELYHRGPAEFYEFKAAFFEDLSAEALNLELDWKLREASGELELPSVFIDHTFSLFSSKHFQGDRISLPRYVLRVPNLPEIEVRVMSRGLEMRPLGYPGQGHMLITFGSRWGERLPEEVHDLKLELQVGGTSYVAKPCRECIASDQSGGGEFNRYVSEDEACHIEFERIGDPGVGTKLSVSCDPEELNTITCRFSMPEGWDPSQQEDSLPEPAQQQLFT